MVGIVQKVIRSIWEIANSESLHRHDEHAIRKTFTSAVMKGSKGKTLVSIDEDAIRSLYGRKNITEKLIDRLNNDLSNKSIKYRDIANGDFHLVGDLKDLISK